MRSENALPAAVVVGGNENAVSVARNLSAAGISVHFLNRRAVPACWSRHGQWIALEGGPDAPRHWLRFLLGHESDYLAGAVLLACSDEAIELITDEYTSLAAKFLLEECAPAVRRSLLDKLSTYEIARSADIPVPGFWFVRSRQELEEAAAQCQFPVILKPRLSHHSGKIGGRKYLKVARREDLIDVYDGLTRLDISFVVMEFIPGGDECLCSYYCYVDETGKPLVRFTKRHPRRYPPNSGGATFHETTWNPEAAALGERFFAQAGLRGLGNVEFKYDHRDRRLKIIEANARFTAADWLVSRSGIDFARLTYDRLTKRTVTIPPSYRTGMVLWFPFEDFLAFLALRRRGGLSTIAWVRSIVRADLLPFFRWDDPMPSIANAVRCVRSLLARGRWKPGFRRDNRGDAHDKDRGALSRRRREGDRRRARAL
jgi:predicted ATP-grasp superfamily ATP-dependent carboligase